jgi:hypothetical protein
LAIVAGIVVALAGGAAFMAVSSQPSEPVPPADNSGNSTDEGPRQITVDLNESLSVDAK